MSTKPTSTLTFAAVRPLMLLLQNKGLSYHDLAHSGFQPRSKHALTSRVPIAQYDRCLEQASRALNEPAIGMMVGKNLEFSNFYLLTFLLSSCRTGREALALLRRYYSLISDSHSPDIFVGQQSIKVVYYVTDGTPFGCQARSELIATGVHLAGKAFGSNLYQIQGLGFRFPEPPYADRLEHFFGIKPLYNQPQNWVSFHSKLIDKPLIQANMDLFSRLRNDAEAAVSRFNNMHEFSSKVMHILFQWPDSIPITKESVAELLSTSSRTLTRRLQEEGCQFSTLLRDVRLEKAKLALENDCIDVQQLAIDLGFSDRRGFERAFKQWTGKTPASYRKDFQQDTDVQNSVSNA